MLSKLTPYSHGAFCPGLLTETIHPFITKPLGTPNRKKNLMIKLAGGTGTSLLKGGILRP